MHKIHSIGRVGTIETRNFKHGNEDRSVTTISLAGDRMFKNAQGVRETDWLRWKIWNGQGQTLQKTIKVGDLLYLDGYLETSKYDREVGITCPNCQMNINADVNTISVYAVALNFKWLEHKNKLATEQPIIVPTVTEPVNNKVKAVSKSRDQVSIPPKSLEQMTPLNNQEVPF